MKKLIKLLAFALSSCCVLSTVGCVKPSYTIDEKRTQIYVGNYYMGLRDGWLQDAKVRFEEAYKDYVNGSKVGVEVVIDNGQYASTALLNHLRSSRDTVFFSESIDYYTFLEEGVLTDVTDVVTETLTKYGEERSIEDKMSETLVDYFKTDDGKYYGLPFYEASASIAYDIDLFEDSRLYLAKNGCPSEAYMEGGSFNSGYKYTNGLEGSAPKSAGPDGEYGTSDDGLPATYEEFYAVCKNIRKKGITPMIWPGAHQDYFNDFCSALWADYEGLEQMSINYTLTGTAKNLISVDESGNITDLPDLDINNENGKELVKQAGRYYALDFVRTVIRDTDFYDTISISESQSHLDSQNDFLYGRFADSKATVAMLLDGTWWDSEANDTYLLMKSTYGDAAAKVNRRIGLLPLPKATQAQVGKKQTNIILKNSLGFVNAKAIKDEVSLELAKAFLQFCHTDESLEAFTKIQNMPKPYTYEMSDGAKKEMSRFGLDLYEMHCNSDYVFPLSKNPLVLSNSTRFMPIFAWNTKIGTTTESTVTNTFRYNSSVTTKIYFDGLYKERQTSWETDFSRFF